MPRVVPTRELDLIAGVILNYPNGVGITEIEKKLVNLFPGMNRRTLQRRLMRLQKDKRIISKGQSISLIYKITPYVSSLEKTKKQSVSEAVEKQFYIPVSPDGAILRNLVRQSVMQRQPVGYNRSFLEDYEPGITFYIPAPLRAQLHEMGRTPANERPAGTYARDILNRLLIDLSWASSRLEGNTYNRLDTRNLIEFGQIAPGKEMMETQMILNHKGAIEMLIQEAEQVGFNPFTFYNLHAILSDNLLHDENACGRLRRRPVDITGSVYHPTAIPQVLEDCFRLLLQKAAAIPDPFEQSFFVMVQLPYLQPFEDVNKRVSRLGANIPFVRHNLCPLSFMDVPEKDYVEGTLGVYEFNQTDLLLDLFVWAYERSCQRYLAITKTMKEPDPLRIKYREMLIQAVQTIVRNHLSVSQEHIQNLAEQLVPEEDRKVFEKMVKEALQHLHEGSVARYRLKLSEFQSWKK